MNRTQVVNCKCGQKIFAACKEPLCYEDKDWLKNLRKYSKMGCKVEIVDQLDVNRFEGCECMKVGKK